MRICRTSARPTYTLRNEQSLDLRKISKQSSEPFNKGVLEGEFVMGGLPQFLDRLDLGEEPLLLLVGTELDEGGGEEALAEERDPGRRVCPRGRFFSSVHGHLHVARVNWWRCVAPLKFCGGGV